MRIDANITLPQVATPTIPLTLPDVERRVAKLGYRGLRKYLYVSFSEFIPMMTVSAVRFAYMHRNVTKHAKLRYKDTIPQMKAHCRLLQITKQRQS